MKAPLAKCDICSLVDNIFVPSELHLPSRFVLLAEAPGYNETRDQKPMTGSAGAELNRIIADVGVKREHFNILNAVSCRPTEGSKNRTPTLEEIRCCNARLLDELETIAPLVVVTLGKSAYVALGGDSRVVMSDVAGRHTVFKNKFDIYVTYHPAAILHSGTTTDTAKMIRNSIKEQIKMAVEAQPKPKQLRLF